MTLATVHVETAAGRATLAPGDRLTFGRARECGVCLDPDDLAISRIAGIVEFEHGTWWVANASATRPLSVVDDLGFRSVLGPARRAAVVPAPVRCAARPPGSGRCAGCGCRRR